MAENKTDPWPPAQKALFDIIRVWVAGFPEPDQEKAAAGCLEIMEKVNEVKGAPFVFVCELARMVVDVLARYLCACADEFPTAEEMLTEIGMLQLDYLEEFTEAEDDSA
jgi:hypothetical protein